MSKKIKKNNDLNQNTEKESNNNFSFIKKSVIISCLLFAILCKQGCFSDNKKNDGNIKNGKTIELALNAPLEEENLMEIYIQKRYKNYNQLHEEIRSYAKTYIIKQGDSLRSISNTFGLKNTDDLIKLNQILGKHINKNIHPGDIIFVPIDTEIYYENMNQLLYAEQILQNNQLISDGNGHNKNNNVHIESIRYTEVQSLGLPNVIEGFMDNQERGLWTENPNVVDIKWIKTVGCLHALREMARQSINFNDLAGYDSSVIKQPISHAKIIRKYKEKQKKTETLDPININGITEEDITHVENELLEISKLNSEYIQDNIRIGEGINENHDIGNEFEYLMVEDIDAWMVGELLENIGFRKMFSFLIDCFDSNRLTRTNPIKPNYENTYKNYVLTLGEFLEKNDKRLTGTYVAFFFNYSNYRDDMAHYMRYQTTKHYNTHQAMFGRDITLNFKAKEIGTLNKGNRNIKDFNQISVVDLVLNFIQIRGDFGGALGDGIRGITLNSIEDYYPLIHISINGNQINLGEQINQYKKGEQTIIVYPDDNISIFGPALIDAEHQNNYPNNPLKGEDLNMRVRFFFEFLPFYHTTEIFVPSMYSTFAKTDFQKELNKLKIKGLYCLNKGEYLEDALKDEIINYEHLDPNDPNFKKDFRFYYKLQTRTLQLSGFIREKSLINPGACKTFRLIPYFDKKSINTAFTNFINHKKLELKVKNEKMSGIKEYIDIYLFPNDNQGKIYGSIVNQINLHSDKFYKYENLHLINHLNFLQRGILLYMIGDKAVKTDQNILPEDIVRGFIPESHSILISLKELDEILKTINQITSLEAPTPSYIDQVIIRNIAITEQHRSFLEFILYNETTCTGHIFFGKDIGEIFSEKTLTQIYSRKTVKRLAQLLRITLDGLDIEIYKKKGEIFGHTVPLISFSPKEGYEREAIISSVSDYQVQPQIRNGWSKRGWITRNQMITAIQLCQEDRVIDLVNSQGPSHREQYKKDIQKLEQIAKIIGKNQLTEHDFAEIDKLLTSIGTINGGPGTNIVSKVIFSYLVLEKVKLNIQNTYGFLIPMGLNLGEIYNHPNKIKSLNKIIALSNNAGENDTLLALAENYIIRIANSILEEKLQTQDVYSNDDFDRWKGKIKYGKHTFINHLNSYISQSENSPTAKDSIILKKLKTYRDQFWQNLKEHKGTNILTINFVNDKALKHHLKSKGLSPIILPELEEFSGNDFQKSIFNYVNKTYHYGKLSDFQKQLILLSGIALIGSIGLFITILYLIRKLIRKLLGINKKQIKESEDEEDTSSQYSELNLKFKNDSEKETEETIEQNETGGEKDEETNNDIDQYEGYRGNQFKIF